MKFSSLRRAYVSRLRLSLSTCSEQETLKTIQSYRDNPVGDSADRALRVAGSFAAQSRAVRVDLRPIYFPWELGSIDNATEIKFLGAFVAGNLEHQLTNSVNENRPFEGIRLQLLTYERMKEADAIEALPEFEGWLDLRHNGELDTLFEN